MAGTDKREVAALEETLKNYRTTNSLIREIVADSSEPSEQLKKVTKGEAEVALGRIASIVESKVGADDLDEVNEFLLLVGRNVATAASENALGMGDKVSKYETGALKELEVLLRATDAQKKARRDNALKEKAAAAATAKQQADTQAKAEQARKEAAAKAEDARKEATAKERLKEDREEAAARRKEAEQKERLETAREQAEARKKEADQKERLETARDEAEARQKEAQAEREALKAREEAARVEAEAKAREEAARAEAAKQAAAAAPRFKEFIAEHTVVAGDNLSFISQKYYGTQANFRLIYEANKDVIGDNMSLIRPGQKLRIPKL